MQHSVSSGAVTGLYELWLVVPASHNELLNGCGMFRSRVDAECVAAALNDWFWLQAWDEELMDRFDPATTDDLWYTREGLMADGVNLATVRVKVQPAIPVMSDHGLGYALYVADEGDDRDDTEIVDLNTTYEATDGTPLE